MRSPCLWCLAADSSHPAVFPHTFALFAPDPDTYNVSALLTYLPDNPTLCKVGAAVPALAGYIVLAMRDTERACKFLDIAQTAEKAQAAGVIIMDTGGSDVFTVQFLGPPSDYPLVNIPVIFVTGKMGQQLQSVSGEQMGESTVGGRWSLTSLSLSCLRRLRLVLPRYDGDDRFRRSAVDAR